MYGLTSRKTNNYENYWTIHSWWRVFIFPYCKPEQLTRWSDKWRKKGTPIIKAQNVFPQFILYGSVFLDLKKWRKNSTYKLKKFTKPTECTMRILCSSTSQVIHIRSVIRQKMWTLKWRVCKSRSIERRQSGFLFLYFCCSFVLPFLLYNEKVAKKF